MNRHVPAAIRLLDARDDGRDARLFTFAHVEPSEAPREAQPGQFFMLNVPGSGESAFTYSALPDDHGHFSALVRRVGQVTDALFRLAPGALLGARGPFGHGWPADALQAPRVLVVGGGCGLAPLVPAVDQLLQRQAPSACAVLYSARDPASQVLRSARERWRPSGMLHEVTDHPDRIGPVPHLDALLERIGGLPTSVLVCGPEAMMEATASALIQRGVPAERLFLSLERRMHCGTGQCGHCYIGSGYCCTDGPVMSQAQWDALRHPGARQA